MKFTWKKTSAPVVETIVEPTFCGVSKEQAKTLAVTGTIIGASTAVGAGAVYVVSAGVSDFANWVNNKIQTAWEATQEARAAKDLAKAISKKEKEELAGKK